MLLSLLAGSSVALIAITLDIITDAMRVTNWVAHGFDFCLMLAFWTVAFGVLFAQIRQRQEAARSHEQQLAELNRNIRNALTVLLAPGLPLKRNAIVREAVERIDQTLRRVVSVAGKKPPQPLSATPDQNPAIK